MSITVSNSDKETSQSLIQQRIHAWSRRGFFRASDFAHRIEILSIEEKRVFEIEAKTLFCMKTEETKHYRGVPDAYDRREGLALPFDDGIRQTLVVDRTSDCEDCRATGGDACFLCQGDGCMTCEGCSGTGGDKCSSCSGEGKLRSFCHCINGADGWGERCPSCGGSGSTEQECWSCFSSGWKICVHCGGRRETACAPCNGKGFIACQNCRGFRQTSVATLREWRYETLLQKKTVSVEGLPEAWCRRALSEAVFSETSPDALDRARTVPGFPSEAVENLQKAVHARTKTGAIPELHNVLLNQGAVQEVRYTLAGDETNERQLWVAGKEVYAPNAPLHRGRIRMVAFVFLAMPLLFALFRRG